MTDGQFIEQQAADWLIREDRGLDFRERAEFDHWLSENTHHRVAYLRLKRTWISAGQLSEPSSVNIAPAHPHAKRVVRNLPRWAAAAALLVTLGATAWYLTPSPVTTFATG